MTPQQITSIDFREIKAIDLICKECGGMIRLPLPKDELVAPINCPGCNRRLADAQLNDSYTLAWGLIRALSNWTRSSSALPFSLGFTIKQ